MPDPLNQPNELNSDASRIALVSMIPTVGQQPPPASISLPSEHINHTALFENELNNRAHGFESARDALEAELHGKQQKHAAEIAEKTARHEVECADLLRRIDDIKTAIRMAEAGLAGKNPIEGAAP